MWRCFFFNKVFPGRHGSERRTGSFCRPLGPLFSVAFDTSNMSLVDLKQYVLSFTNLRNRKQKN